MIEILLIVLLIFALFGAPYGWHRRADWGPGPWGVSTLLLVLLLVLLFYRL